MNLKIYITYCFFLLLFWIIPPTAIHANDATEAFKQEKLQSSEFDKKVWKATASDLNYYKKKKVEKKKIKPPPATTTRSSTMKSPISFKEFSQGILFLLGVLLVAFVIFKMVVGDAILSNKRVIREEIIPLAEIETNLEKADVEGFLKQALSNQDHRLAIRLYYLAIIKELSKKGYITWKKDKTNGHYMNEMRRSNHPQLQNFRNVTRIFEYVWYSDVSFDGGKFAEVKTDFKKLLTTLK